MPQTARELSSSKVGDQGIAQVSKRLLQRARQRLNLRDNLYVLPAFGYGGAMLTYFLLYGKLLQFLPVLFFLAAIPVMALLGSSKGMARYWVPFISILLWRAPLHVGSEPRTAIYKMVRGADPT